MNQKLNQSLWSAYESLRVAERELMRPNEDAVTLCACQCTRNSACEFLRSFLFSKTFNPLEILPTGFNRFENSSLSDLLRQCAKIDPHFNAIDLACFDCRNAGSGECEKDYCLSVEKVNECFERTHVIRELVMAKLKLLEKDFR